MTKLKGLTCVALWAVMGVSTAQAAGGGGKIEFEGSIVDAPCSIKPGEDGDDQSINMGGISNVVLGKNGNTGSSTPQGFKIELLDCSVGTGKTVTATFSGTGSSYDKDNFGLFGNAQGASLQLEQSDGTRVKLGQPSAAQNLVDGNNTMNFQAKLVGGGASATIVPGAFNVPTTFALTYP